MTFICKICEEDPTSHSLLNLGMYDNITYFYTCPAQASKYNDAIGIIEHYDGVLSENVNKWDKWAWVFDCKDFHITHLLEINVAIQLANLITNKFSHNLERIIIINQTWHIKLLLDIVYPFLNDHVKSIITIV